MFPARGQHEVRELVSTGSKVDLVEITFAATAEEPVHRSFEELTQIRKG